MAKRQRGKGIKIARGLNINVSTQKNSDRVMKNVGRRRKGKSSSVVMDKKRSKRIGKEENEIKMSESREKQNHSSSKKLSFTSNVIEYSVLLFPDFSSR